MSGSALVTGTFLPVSLIVWQLNCIMRVLVLGVFDQVRHKPGCKTTEACKRLEISDIGKEVVAKRKTLISCTFTAQLILTFVFTSCKRQVFT